MTSILQPPQTYTQRQQTTVTCTRCNKETVVPFTPMPGRPVFCRPCFAKKTGIGQPPRPRPPPVPGARKRMLAQARKGHFMYDSKEILGDLEGGMDEKNVRSFLEGLFARGARQSTEDAQVFLDEKMDEGNLMTLDQRNGLGRLLERYSFWR